MATLAGNTIASTYPLLLKIDSNGIDGTLRTVQDGDATDSSLSISTTAIKITGDGATDQVLIENTNTGADNAPDLVLYRNSSSPADSDSIGRVEFRGRNDNSQDVTYANLEGVIIDASDGTEDSRLIQSIIKGGSSVIGFKSDNTEFAINESGVDMDFRVEGDGNPNALMVNGQQSFVGIGTATPGYTLDRDDDSSPVDHRGGNTETTSLGTSGLLHLKGLVPRILLEDVGTDGTSGDQPNYAIEAQDYFSIIEMSATDTAETTRLRINSSGNVGIGTTSPTSAKLQIESVSSGDAGIQLTQQQNEIGISVDNNGHSDGIKVENSGSNGMGLHIYSNRNADTTNQLVRFHVDNTAFDQPVLQLINDGTSLGQEIQNNGTGSALSIDQNGNGTSLSIDSESTTENVVTFVTPTTTTATVLAAVNANSLTTGKVAYFHSDSTDTTSRELVTIHNDSSSATGAVPLFVEQDANTNTVVLNSNRGDLSNDVMRMNAVGRSSTANFSFLVTRTGGDSDFQHAMKGDGTVVADGAYDSGGADYAEYFESKDGKAIAIGTTIKLDGDKIVACEDGDTPIGVIRPKNTSASIGNTSSLKWNNKYLKDDYGAYIMEEYSVTEWIEETDEIKTEAVEKVLYVEGDNIPEGKEIGDVKIEAKAATYETKDVQYQTDKIPSDVKVPSDATVLSIEKDGTKLMRRKLNPDYDESKTYVPREDRDGWNIVGLLGQVQITKGQPVSSNWIKMKDISDTVEMWYIK